MDKHKKSKWKRLGIVIAQTALTTAVNGLIQWLIEIISGTLF